jgi:hypothetical protein
MNVQLDPRDQLGCLFSVIQIGFDSLAQIGFPNDQVVFIVPIQITLKKFVETIVVEE